MNQKIVLHYLRHTKVRFMRRSAYDFFHETEKGRAFINCEDASRVNAYRAHSQILLALAVMAGFTEDICSNEIEYVMEEIFEYIALAENESAESQRDLVDHIDTTISRIPAINGIGLVRYPCERSNSAFYMFDFPGNTLISTSVLRYSSVYSLSIYSLGK